MFRVQDVKIYPRDEAKVQALRQMIWISNPDLYISNEEILAQWVERPKKSELRSDTYHEKS
jgi:hypothetical protein